MFISLRLTLQTILPILKILSKNIFLWLNRHASAPQKAEMTR